MELDDVFLGKLVFAPKHNSKNGAWSATIMPDKSTYMDVHCGTTMVVVGIIDDGCDPFSEPHVLCLVDNVITSWVLSCWD